MAVSGPFRLRDLLRDKTGFTVTTQVPAGVVHQFAGSAAPSGYLICDGTSLSTTTYSALFAAIGYAYGGSGGTFNLPDMRGRVPVGVGTHSDVNALNKNDGISTVANRRPKHQHTVYDPGHNHTFSGTTSGMGHNLMRDAGGGGNVAWVGGNNMSGIGDHTHTFSGTTSTPTTGMKVNPEGASSSTSPVDTMPFITINYIIKT